MNEPIHRQSACGLGKHLQYFGGKLTIFLLCFKFCRAGAAGCPWPEGNLVHSPDYGLKVGFPSLICSDKCPCLSWPLRNLVLVIPRGPSHGFRALDGSGMEWCIPLSVQYPLLSGWELGWPFRALQTQPFMSRFHSQTTTMTLPSSSSSTTSSSPCAHIVSPRLCLEFFVRGEMRTRVCSCAHGACNSERRAFERWRRLLQFARCVAQHRPGCDRGQITRFPHSSACCQSSWVTGSMENKPAFLTTNMPKEQMTQIKCSCTYVERIFLRLRNCIICLLASFQSGNLENIYNFKSYSAVLKFGWLALVLKLVRKQCNPTVLTENDMSDLCGS